ncbi:murein biosynthesis integral membrane protein MurJ [Croceivirga radicis]|uniref:murein biosynthesis integral membrane protein MurJ n=1 Tax=Croceivirga radicis TaxID=1929488 RepID=UPI0015956DFB|nr:lipid II flippase MurJ [Croceivirga radicis]
MRNILVVSGITFAISLLGFYKETIIAAEFGLSVELDTFFIALIIPGLINSVFIGSYKTIFIPNYILNLKENKDSSSFIATSLTITLVFSILSVIIITLFYSSYLNYMFPGKDESYYNLIKSQLYIISPSILFWGYSSILGALLNAHEEYKLSTIANIFTPIFIIVLVLLSKFFNRANILAWGTLLGAISSAVFLTIIVFFKRLKPLGKVYFKEKNIILLIKQLPAKISSSLFTAFIEVVDQFFAAQLIIGSLAALNYGLKIPAFATSILVIALNNVLLPYFSKAALDNRGLAFKNLFKNLNFVFFFTLIVAFTGILCSDFIVELLFQRNNFTKEDSYVVSNIQQIFLAYLPFKICGMIMVNFSTSINKNNILAYIAFLSVVINVILDYILIRFYGIFGIAFCTTIITALRATTIYLYLRYLQRQNSVITG